MSPLRTISVGRAIAGTSLWLLPTLTAQLFGFQPREADNRRYIGRLSGAREVALGLAPLMSTGEERARWLRMNIAVDAADTLAAIAGLRTGYLTRFQAVSLAAFSIGSAALTAAALRESLAASPAA